MEQVLKVKAYKVNKEMRETNQIRKFYAHDNLKQSFREFKLRVWEVFQYEDGSVIDIYWKGK